MTPIQIYDQIRYWLPVSGILSIVWAIKRGIKKWADTMLENHMSHIQTSTEQAAAAVTELAGYHRDMLGQQKEIVTSMALIQRDFHEHIREDERVQRDILTGIEVIKSRTTV